MALGDLIVSVRASADQFTADMKKVQQSATSTTDAIVAGWGKSEKAAQEAVTKIERRAQSKVIAREFTSQTDAIVKGFGKTSAAADTAGKRTQESFRNAGAALNQIEQMMGVQLPAALDRFLTHSKTIGPVLNAAFSGVAILGFIGLLTQLPALFDKISGAITGWSEKAKKAYADVLAAQRRTIEANEDLEVSLTRIRFGDMAAITKEIEIQNREWTRQNAIVLDINNRLAERQRLGQRFAGAVAVLTPEEQQQLATAERLRDEAARKREDALGERRKELARDQVRAAETVAAAQEKPGKAAEDAATAAGEAWKRWVNDRFADLNTLETKLRSVTRDAATLGSELLRPGMPGVTAPAAPLIGDIDAAMRTTQELIDKGNALSLKGAEIRADGEIDAARMASEQILKDQERMFQRIEDSAGAVFDAIFQKGQSVFQNLASLGTSLAQTFARTLFQDIAGLASRAILGGQGGVGGTLAGQLPGVASLLGLGKGFAFSGAKFASIVPGAPGFTLGATGGGAGGMGAAIGALATNPITIAAAAALIGGTAWAKSQAHHEANTFVKEFQNPLGRAMESIVNSSKTAADKLASINSLWEDFEANAQQFAAAGSDEAKVVQQAFETLQPLVDRIRGDLRGLAGPGGPATIMLQLDKRTVARLIIPDLYALTRNEGMQLQPTPTR